MKAGQAYSACPAFFIFKAGNEFFEESEILNSRRVRLRGASDLAQTSSLAAQATEVEQLGAADFV